LRVDRLPSGHRRLVRPVVFHFDDDVGIPLGTADGFDVEDGRTKITVPACFVTDFSSIPAPARMLYRFSSVDLAGVCHDWAYRMGVNRRLADQCWMIVARSGETRDARIGPVRGWLGYAALRLFGHWAYNGNRDKRERNEICDPVVGEPCTCQPCGDAKV
jgi:hypothetical protein